MSYDVDDNFPEVNRVFGPTMYRSETLTIIRDNIGKNPKAVIQEITPDQLGIQLQDFQEVRGQSGAVVDTPQAQFQAAVRSELLQIENALDRFRDLDEMQEAGQVQWCGPDAVREQIDTWVERQRRYKDRKRSNPGGKAHHPEMSAYDRRGQRQYQGEGSDVGRVRRYDLALLDEGFTDDSDFTQDLQSGNGSSPAGDSYYAEEIEEGDDYLDCPVHGCNERQNIKTPDSNRSRQMSRAMLAKHLKNGDADHQGAYRFHFG